MAKQVQFDFEWDPHKAAENLRKHGVSFEEAATVFLDPLSMAMTDEDHSCEEERWLTQGLSENGRLLVVVHTFDEVDQCRPRIRLISSRRATRRERSWYEEQS